MQICSLWDICKKNERRNCGAGISVEALTRILKDFTEIWKDISKPNDIGNSTMKFIIEKFRRKTSNVYHWMNIFEAKCTDLGIKEEYLGPYIIFQVLMYRLV